MSYEGQCVEEAYNMLWKIYEPHQKMNADDDISKRTITISVRELLDIINKLDEGMER